MGCILTRNGKTYQFFDEPETKITSPPSSSTSPDCQQPEKKQEKSTTLTETSK